MSIPVNTLWLCDCLQRTFVAECSRHFDPVMNQMLQKQQQTTHKHCGMMQLLTDIRSYFCIIMKMNIIEFTFTVIKVFWGLDTVFQSECQQQKKSDQSRNLIVTKKCRQLIKCLINNIEEYFLRILPCFSLVNICCFVV